MIKMSTRTVLVTAVLIFGFFAGLIVASNLGLVTLSQSQDQTKTPAAPSSADAAQGRAILKQFSAAFEEAAAQVDASVVAIFSEQTVERGPFTMQDDQFRDFFGDDFFRRFFGAPGNGSNGRQRVRGLGSGVIVSQDGYILTNNHVVADADKVTVMVGENKKYTAKVIGTDPPTDLAVVKIDADNLPVAKMGNSDNVRIGQWVIAVGNPFQLLHTVTAGIISAKGRSAGITAYEDFIQTDASINPGNSGGALADLEGNVIGINTAISSPSGGNVGIGFAIPINMAKQVMDELVEKGKVTRGYLALVPQDIDEGMAKALNLKNTDGALVGDVTPGGPADKAGVKRGDVIVSFNGKKITGSAQLRQLVAQADPNTTAKLVVLRDGRETAVSVVLGERPKEFTDGGEPQEEQAPEEGSGEKLGISVQTLTPEIAQQLGYRNEQGVVVSSVSPGSAADEAGLRRGDLIKEVNRMEVANAQDFRRAMSRLRSGDSAALLVRRGQNTFYVAVPIP